MKRTIIILLLSMPVIKIANAQQIFEYHKTGSTINLSRDQTLLTFYPYQKKPGNVREREASVNRAHYRFVITKRKEGYYQEIIDSTNTRLAVIWLSGKMRYRITLPDSSELSMIKANNESWGFQKDGKEMVKGSYRKGAHNKLLIVDIDPALAAHRTALQLICLERGTDMLVQKSNSGRAIMAGLLVGLLSGLMNGSHN